MHKHNLELIAGQHMIIGIEGTTYGHKLDKHLTEIKPTGIILFDRNIENYIQLVEFIQQIKECLKGMTGENPFICIDHEGGRINRLTNIYKVQPSAWDIGKFGNFNLAQTWSELLTKNIKNLGFNTNFAPCLDIFTNPDNKCLEGRCFSHDPKITADFGELFIKKSRELGVLTCAKHFPGLGDADFDTHFSKAVIKRNSKELLENELIPFKKAIDNNVPMIMINHCTFINIDNKPASLSKKIVTRLLRENLKYDGLILTDDLRMKSISGKFSSKDLLRKSILAGNDILLVCHDPKLQIQYHEILTEIILKEFKDDPQFEKSNERIRKIKNLL
jgi:beta-N-acetylhexosaminidase